jgi:hypothetical protein
MRIVVRGNNLPGRNCSTYQNIHVGLQVNGRPVDLVPGDAPEGRWEADVDVIDHGGTPDFRGPAVHGAPGERFLYLTWGTYDGSTFDMFRRAKIVLDDSGIAPETTEATVTVNLTDADGLPRCARLRPPAVEWEVRDGAG